MSLKDKIAELEKRIEELEKRPPVVIHNHPQQTNPTHEWLVRFPPYDYGQTCTRNTPYLHETTYAHHGPIG